MPPKLSLKSEPPQNLTCGPNCSIQPSSIFIIQGEGRVELKGNNYIGRNVEIGTEGLISIGKGTTVQDRCIILGDVEIGKHCLFSLNVLVSSGRHYYNYKPEYYIRDQDKLVDLDKELSAAHSRKVIIGDDCWIGINSVIMAGLKIGRGSIIGSNAVVTKDVEPFSIMGGVPATLIKKRLDFVLKSKIDYKNDSDLPNFYKGFALELKNLLSDRSNGGLSAYKSITCYLDSEKKSKIQLCLKGTSSGLSIKYNNQVRKISENEFTKIEFDIENTDYHLFSFEPVLESENHQYALVKEIVTF